MSFDEQEMGDPVIAEYEKQRIEDKATIARLTAENERLRKRVEYLEAFITDIPCDCEDEHGYPRSYQCARCCAINATDSLRP